MFGHEREGFTIQFGEQTLVVRTKPSKDPQPCFKDVLWRGVTPYDRNSFFERSLGKVGTFLNRKIRTLRDRWDVPSEVWSPVDSSKIASH